MRTLRDILEASARAYSSRTAIQLGSEQLTYAQLHDQVIGTAAQLQQLDISAESTAVLVFQNTPACIRCFLALAYLHAAVVPVGAEVSAREIEAIVEDIPRAAVFAPAALLAQLRAGYTRQCPPCIALEQLSPSDGCPADVPVADPADRVFLYHYTSGSTGKPKAAMHSQVNLVNGGIIYHNTYSIRPDTTLLVPIPLHHSFGMVAGLVSTLVSGARLLLVERFIPNRLVELLARERASLLLGVPLIYDLMSRCALPYPPDLGALRVCLSSGAPLASETAQRFQSRYQQAIYQVYGSTETGVIAAHWPGQDPWPAQSVGHPLIGVQVRVVDDDGHDVPADADGDLLVKTPSMFRGYLHHPELTASRFRDTWYLTGDMARRDRRGCLYLVGRKDTFINVGGKKVNPAEVEEVLLSCRAVREALVFGADAGNDGQYVCATVALSEGVSEEELIAFCRRSLAAYKVPHHIEIVDELPRTSMGKVRRVQPSVVMGREASAQK
jgi:long-chain acyl-CoA synthetase